ncbi:hypothetical protein SBA5_1080013 [Candidatus Sulfotelmatomonas gaucii]|uniref:Uncharacterized protein n=1 Tax=Candidatus Sulfuritelmatomonas gaucii TaxID=2043161 RepID=A0A2N9L3M4_9BACT|nr:hypothetical protein SBA5_1080013 [Candidatus Sulfotelmatomonas gaucii]
MLPGLDCAHSTCPVAAPLPATRAHQLPVSTLATHPLIQGLDPLVDLVPANLAARPDGAPPLRSTLERRFWVPVRSMQRVS